MKNLSLSNFLGSIRKNGGKFAWIQIKSGIYPNEKLNYNKKVTEIWMHTKKMFENTDN